MDEPQDGWTLNTLLIHLSQRLKAAEEHFDEKLANHESRNLERFKAAERAVEAALAAAKEAVSKAENESNERFRTTNEWRSGLNDFTSKLIGRPEFEQAIRQIIEKIDGPTGLARQVQGLISSGAGRETERAEKNYGLHMFIVGSIGVLGIILSLAALLKGH